LDDDASALVDDPPRKSLVRIILGRPAEGQSRRNGEMYVDRETFLRDPDQYLGFAVDLADAAIHASQLEVEIGYLTGIHELMTMVDAEAVSERITRTVLNLMGLTRGTLFLHDPRLERYV